MSLLSKSEVQYLQGQKVVSKSYERKLKCIIRRKVKGLKRDLLLVSKVIPIEQIFDFEDFVVAKKTKTDQKLATKISNPNISLIGASEISSASDNHHENISRNSNNHISPTRLNHDKLYNCADFIHPKGVRSVVRISRRSSEPQVMGSKPTGPVNHMGSNISESNITRGERRS
jgi:hypothetical protein